MIVTDARTVTAADPMYDVCIVGAGAAGITLALELDGTRHRICLLEAGGLSYARDVQKLFTGSIEGDRFPPLSSTRLGAFGGTTAVWAGWCRALEPTDFNGRPEVETCAWPFTADELAADYEHARTLCGVAQSLQDSHERFADDELPSPRTTSAWPRDSNLVPCSDPDLVHHTFLVNACHFGRRYRDRLTRSRNVVVCLNAPVTRFIPAEGGEHIGSAEVHLPDGTRASVTARAYVLCAGGIENPRLLLLSAETPDRAPGNQHDLVGRFFADHAFLDPGEMTLEVPLSLDRYFPRTSVAGTAATRSVLSFRHDTLRRHRMLNAGVFFYPRYESHAAFASPQVKAFLELVNRLRHKAVPGDLHPLVTEAIWSPSKVATAALRRLLVRQGPARRWRVRSMFETKFQRNNRVSLSHEKDALGRPRPHLRWRLSDLDLHSMSMALRLLERSLRSSGIGRLTYTDAPSALRAAAEGGKHHMGTTRMHADPRRGVVDANFRVHGTSNLFVAGSSVFPSGGYANPTLTIVALAVRLAGQLRRRHE